MQQPRDAIKRALVVAVVLVAGTLAYSAIGSRLATTAMAYSELRQAITAGRVTEVSVSRDTIYARIDPARDTRPGAAGGLVASIATCRSICRPAPRTI